MLYYNKYYLTRLLSVALSPERDNRQHEAKLNYVKQNTHQDY